MKIKVCGITEIEQLKALPSLEVDYAGMIFYEASPRYVGQKISRSELTNILPPIKKVGVFVNSTYEKIMETVALYKPDLVQLHGDESSSFCKRVNNIIPVIRSFRITTETKNQIEELSGLYDNSCNYFLFDTGSKGSYGGTGKKFDWNILIDCKISKPFFISGGISIHDILLIKKFQHPNCIGVDINSQFEKSPGIKDLELIGQFVAEIKNEPA